MAVLKQIPSKLGVMFAVVKAQVPNLGTVISVGSSGLSSFGDETSAKDNP